ncbi:right-handed parallel beta-helix repeat-containing protein [Arthrobacter sp. Hor0625]|uniref:right-handed parallel beta-helix repeat-containing protein n=1 Tax=Arthrobacter sp. Hor0625 TaxID=3457358 RepID=UPI00403EDD30
MKKPFLAVLLATGFAGAGIAAPAATAAELRTVCTSGCGYASIQSAVDAAQPGDTIQVQGTLAVSGTTVVNKDVTVAGAPGATVTQTTNAVTVLLAASGASLTDLTITSNVPYPQEFIQVGAADVTISGNTVYGPAQALPMSSWVANRGVVTQGSITGLTLSNNNIYSVRSGAYLNPNGSGLIEGNTLYNTKGDFLIDNANFSFQDNRSGDPAMPSEWGFVVFGGTERGRYPSMAVLSAANNGMSAWDQRTGEKVVLPLSAQSCKNDGWKSFMPAFKNQGQCIKFVKAT